MYYNDNSQRQTRNQIRSRKRRNKFRFAVFILIVTMSLTGLALKFLLPILRPEEVYTPKEDKIYSEKKTKELATEEKIDRSVELKTETEVTEAKTEIGEFVFDMESVQGPLKYYNQTDKRWDKLLYGPKDPIGSHGCGPTVMATIISSLTEQKFDPKTMSDWAYTQGYCAVGNGSLHSLIPEAAKAFGLKVTPLGKTDEKTLVDTLKSGKIVVMLSGHGVFSDSDGHFIILRQIKENGKIMISDSVKLDHVFQEWDPKDLVKESSNGAGAGGPFWAIYK